MRCRKIGFDRELLRYRIPAHEHYVEHKQMPNFLLLQIRNHNDPMREQEVGCFARALDCPRESIDRVDLLGSAPTTTELERADIVLLGGSGDYSVTDDGPWLERALDSLRRLTDLAKPTFASCWGFQAFARALGGRCIHDPAHAELGNVKLELTAAGQVDPLFGQLPNRFLVHAGHEDHVVALPPGAVLLASSADVRNQAFRLAGLPIYCTQFHPELDCASLLQRVEAYPRYVERIAGVSFDEFTATCRETPEANTLLRRFVEMVC